MMNSRSRRSLGLLLLALSPVAASSVPAEPPPAFILEWGSFGGGNGQFFTPWDVAVDADGNIIVADTENVRVQRFDKMGVFLKKWSTSTFVWYLTGDAVGNIFTTEGYGCCPARWKVRKYASNGTFRREWGSAGSGEGQFDYPRGVVADSYGHVYVVDKYNHRIQKFGKTGGFLRTWGFGVRTGASVFQICTGSCQAGVPGNGSGQFNGPLGIAVDSSDNIYVADANNSRIEKFNSDGTYLAQWATPGFPNNIAVDARGNVFVVDRSNDRIYKHDKSGQLLTQWGSTGSGPGEFDHPDGVAVDPAGNIYVSEPHRIQKFGGPWLDFFVGEPELPSGH